MNTFSLMSDDAAHNPEGLCGARFHADYVTHDLDYASLAVGAAVAVDGRELIVTRVGKECHAECPLVQAGRTCKLKHNCAFARAAQENDTQNGKEDVRA